MWATSTQELHVSLEAVSNSSESSASPKPPDHKRRSKQRFTHFRSGNHCLFLSIFRSNVWLLLKWFPERSGFYSSRFYAAAEASQAAIKEWQNVSKRRISVQADSQEMSTDDQTHHLRIQSLLASLVLTDSEINLILLYWGRKLQPPNGIIYGASTARLPNELWMQQKWLDLPGAK